MKKLVYVLGIALLAACGNQAQTEETTEVAVSDSTEVSVPTNAKAAFKVEGMVCDKGCAPKIKGALKALPGVGKVCAKFETKVAWVRYDSTLVTKAQLQAAIAGIDGGGVYKAIELTETECQALCKKHECTEKCAKEGCSKDAAKCSWSNDEHKCSAECAKDGCKAEGKKCTKDCTKPCCTKDAAKACKSGCKKECCKKK